MVKYSRNNRTKEHKCINFSLMNGETIRIQNPKSTVNYRHNGYNIKEHIAYDSITNTNTYSNIRLEDNKICYVEVVEDEVNKE